MTNLEQSMSGLLEEHGLLSISVAYSGHGYFTVSFQWTDLKRDGGRGCILTHGYTVAEALGKAIAERAARDCHDLVGELAA